MSMKNFLLIPFFSGNLFAAALECRALINRDIVTEAKVVTSLKNKISIGRHSQIISYVTEIEEDVFSVEAFIPELDTRIYSEGPLKTPGESLTAAAWARDVLVDVSCKKLKE